VLPPAHALSLSCARACSFSHSLSVAHALSLSCERECSFSLSLSVARTLSLLLARSLSRSRSLFILRAHSLALFCLSRLRAPSRSLIHMYLSLSHTYVPKKSGPFPPSLLARLGGIATPPPPPFFWWLLQMSWNCLTDAFCSIHTDAHSFLHFVCYRTLSHTHEHHVHTKMHTHAHSYTHTHTRAHGHTHTHTHATHTPPGNPL